MIDYYAPLYSKMQQAGLGKWAELLPEQVNEKIIGTKNGNLKPWLDALKKLPNISPSMTSLNRSHITTGTEEDLSPQQKRQLTNQLRCLTPWRKGPYELFGVKIDTEWHSDWKWNRLAPHIANLSGKTVLDVGCGNGYHSWRMAGAGAKLVIGVDPSLLFVMQYAAVRKYLGDQSVYVLPLKLEDIPENLPHFDSVFSMGVLYHRRSPFDHLTQLKGLLKPGGELILETLVVEGEENTVLVPKDRYAQMNNVWFLPSCKTLAQWLQRAGFNNVHLVDVNQTSIEEQRVTDWMQFESLKKFLDPNNLNKTIEGYQAPTRAIFLANRPS